MKKLFAAAAITLWGLIPLACTRPLLGPPLPPATTPTPSFTPTTTIPLPILTATATPPAGCLVPPVLVVSHSSGGPMGNCFPSVIIISGLVTPIPTATPAYTGAVPTHPDGEFVLQTAGDWSGYVAGSYFPASPAAAPFNPASQRLAVLAYSSGGSGTSAIIQVCDDGTAIHVLVQHVPACYGNPPAYPCDAPQVDAVVLPQNGEPVVWDQVYVACPPGIL